MGFTSFRVAHRTKNQNRPAASKPDIDRLRGPLTHRTLIPRADPNPSCTTGGFYTAPQPNSSVDSLKPLVISWDNTCLPTDAVDIHLIAPWFHGDNTEVWTFPKVPFAPGQYSATLNPRWWNASTQVQLQLAIVPAGTPPSLTTLPAGPLFVATYDGSSHIPADDPAPGQAGAGKRVSKGGTAAAVLLPLIAVAVFVAVYFRRQRRKVAERSHRFSQAIDKRMSTISTDWKSMSAAGAQAAIRSSMAINRDSTASAFAFGAIRPVSAIEPSDHPQMKQVRTGTGVGLRHPGTASTDFAAERASRVSRVSFADTGRPSTDAQRPRPSAESRRTRAFHSAYIPPVPALDARAGVVSTASVYPDSDVHAADPRPSEESENSQALSPRQTTGPLTLTPDDIRARIQGRGAETDAAVEKEDELEAVMPALSMMRTGVKPPSPVSTQPSSVPQTQDEYLFTPLPQPPLPTHASPMPTSPFNAYQPTTPTTGAGFSPDDALRAYAERQAASAGGEPPSAFTPLSPKTKGRKLSLRNGFGIRALQKGDKDRVPSPAPVEKAVIGYPKSVATAGMVGVGPRAAGAGAGMAAGAAYAIGEDEEDMGMDWEDAYAGVGTAA